jgi:hypothetical protein
VVVVEVNGYTIEPGADLVRADLTGARANSDTTWPEGFTTWFTTWPKITPAAD